MKDDKKQLICGVFYALLAAALYSLSAPISKILLTYIPLVLTAGFLYLGAALGMGAVALIRKAGIANSEKKLTASEIPYVIAMILLDIAAPILLLFGLETTSSATASLLNNFEIVATAILARLFFSEKISARLYTGISVITLSCMLLSFENISDFRFSVGSLLIILAALCWGIENNCTKKISSCDPMQTVLLKGIFSGGGAILIGFFIGERTYSVVAVIAAVVTGIVSYGLSIFFYVYSQRKLGAARTSAFYAVSPFLAVLLSFLLFRETPVFTYYIALCLMIIGAWLSCSDRKIFRRTKQKAK